jgi:hypothetical protein
LDVIVKRRTDRIYDEGGWGKQLNFTAARRTGKPLFVQLRVMKTMELQVRDGVEPPTVFDGELVADGEALVSFRLEFEEGHAPAVEDFPDPGEPWVHQEVTKLSDKAIQVMRVNNEPRLEMIYALHSQFGALTFIFNTANEGMLGPEARDMYRKTVETTWIGTKKRLY